MHMHVQRGATSSKFEVMHDDIVAGAAVEGPMHYNRPLSQYHDAAPGCFPIIIITFYPATPYETHTYEYEIGNARIKFKKLNSQFA